MNRRRLKQLLVTAFLVVTLIDVVLAQEKIIFSKPADTSATAKADSNLAPDETHQTRSLFSLPASIFIVRTPSSTPVAGLGGQSESTVSPAQQKAWNKTLEDKKNWTLLTPSEILGLPTPEKILGLPDKNDDSKLTSEERFNRRQEKMINGITAEAPTPDTTRRADALVRNRQTVAEHKLFESPFSSLNDKRSAAQNINAEGKSLKPTSSSWLNSPFAVAQKVESAWGNTFNLPAAPSKPTPEQMAGMDRFRQSMEPSLVMEKAVEPVRFQTPVAPVRDSFMNVTPDFNPHGNTFARLRNEAARPHGLTPLPSVATHLPTPPVKSPSQPNLPPWLRNDGSIPAGVPVRKF